VRVRARVCMCVCVCVCVRVCARVCILSANTWVSNDDKMCMYEQHPRTSSCPHNKPCHETCLLGWPGQSANTVWYVLQQPSTRAHVNRHCADDTSAPARAYQTRSCTREAGVMAGCSEYKSPSATAPPPFSAFSSPWLLAPMVLV
jgi:hypothetical protein